MRAAAFLGRLFNIRPGEWSRLLLLYSMSLTVLTGLTWTDAIVQAAFLQRVGVQYLPWVFISCAAFSFGALFIYSAFADRVSNTRLLIALLAISGAGILLGLAALAGGLVGLGYLVLFVVLQVPLLDVYNIHWATYVNGFYDIRTAKRIVPVLSTTARFAGIIGGLSMPLVNRALSPAAIVLVGVASLAVMAVLAAAMPRLLHEQQVKPTGRTGPDAGPALPPATLRLRVRGFAGAYGATLREGYRMIARSSFLRWMAISTFSMAVLLAFLNYGASAIFQEKLKTTVAISDFLGLLSGVANLVVLPFQLLVLSRLIGRLGLANASLIYPFTSVASAAGLAMAPGLGTAAFAYLDRTALRTAFRIPTDNLLYNAVPSRVKARTRAFVGGLVVPLAVILSGLLLLTPLMRTSWFLPAAMLALGIVFAGAALMVRRHYGAALVDLLEQEDYSSLALQAPSLLEPVILAAADPATLSRLAQNLTESTSSERAVFMAQLIVAVGGEAAVAIVGQAAHTATDARLRSSLVDVLVAADLRKGAVRELYVELLADGDARVRLSAIAGLEQIDGPGDRRFLERAALLLADPDIAVRLRVLPALLEADDHGWHTAGVAELRALLAAPDPRVRAQALDVVGQLRSAGFLPEIVSALGDRSDEVRLAAALATEMLTERVIPAGDRDALLSSLVTLLDDPIERVRLAAITILGRLGKDGDTDATAVRGRLVRTLTDPSAEVREQTVEVLVAAGRPAISQLQEQLETGDRHLREMAAVVLARIEPRKYTSLLRGPILDDTLLTIYRNLSCAHSLAGCPGPAAAVLRRALAERNGALLDEVLYLLGTIYDPGAIKTIVHSLRSSQPLVRANATEALESLTAPQTAALVGPLFEPDGSHSAATLLALASHMWGISFSTPASALQLLLNDRVDAWQRTLAAATLVELCATFDAEPGTELAELLRQALSDVDAGVRAEATRFALISAAARSGRESPQPAGALSLVEKLILLLDAPFFQGMTVDQLKALASVCEEEYFSAGAYLFEQGEEGGAFYLVVSGRVGIEQEKRRASLARLATIEPHGYLGEADFFDNGYRTTSAIALEGTLALRLRREPVIALARQHPSLSLELINVLSGRLRVANSRIADLTRTRPRELHKLFDTYT